MQAELSNDNHNSRLSLLCLGNYGTDNDSNDNQMMGCDDDDCDDVQHTPSPAKIFNLSRSFDDYEYGYEDTAVCKLVHRSSSVNSGNNTPYQSKDALSQGGRQAPLGTSSSRHISSSTSWLRRVWGFIWSFFTCDADNMSRTNNSNNNIVNLFNGEMCHSRYNTAVNGNQITMCATCDCR